MDRSVLTSALAHSFLSGDQSAEAAAARASKLLGRQWKWLNPLAARYIAAFDNGAPSHHAVAAFLASNPIFKRALARHSARIRVAQWIAEPQPMRPSPVAYAWNVPAIESPGALADWLNLDPGALDWFADLQNLTHQPNSPRLEHYHYRSVPKSSGGVRLIESPKRDLKTIQRRILAEILDRIPPHPAVHGFVHRRSIRTFAAPHIGQRVLLRIDLRDFFPSFRAARVQALFRTMGYPDAVAWLLTGLCTNATPRRFCPAELRELYSRPHLPQGAPASPALANLCSRRIDLRLCGLAESAGAVYTRYADDLAFSGDAIFERSVDRFARHAAATLHDEGFTVHHRKTRIMRQSVRQHLAGVIVNRRLNVPRRDYDLLKATLTNCARLGPDSQNLDRHPRFRDHLEGRIAFVEWTNPARGRRLRAIFDTIEWSPTSFN